MHDRRFQQEAVVFVYDGHVIILGWNFQGA